MQKDAVYLNNENGNISITD